MNKKLLDLCTVKTGTFTSTIAKEEITIIQPTIAVSEEYNLILQDQSKTQFDAICYLVESCMVTPKFFTKKQLENLNVIGREFIYEVFAQIPLIGKTEKQKEDYFKKVNEIASKSIKEDSISDEEKKIKS